MKPEERPSKVVSEQMTPFRVGLPKSDIDILERVAMEGQIKNLDRKAVTRIRGAAAFFSGAQMGMQWIDFDNRTDPIVRSNREFYLEQRFLVLATLYPMIYLGRTTLPSRLPKDEAIRIQTVLTGFKKALVKSYDGISLDSSERESMQGAVQFFREFGIKKMQETRRGFQLRKS